MKRSIEKRTLWIFASILIVIIVAGMLISYGNVYSNELNRNRTVGRSAAYVTCDLLDAVGLDELTDPTGSVLYDIARQEMRMICKSLSLAYLYVYSIDENEVRHYVMTAASDDEIDALVKEALGLGVTSREPLREQERIAMQGRESDESFLLNNRFGKTSVWITPYTDDSGRVRALIGAEVSVELSNGEIAKQFMTRAFPAAAVFIIGFLTLFILLRRRVIQPLHTVAERMERFDPAKESEPLTIRSQDEIQQIADAYEKMSSDIRTYIGSIAAITAEQEYERAQLEVARRIQYGMVPASFRSYRDGVEVCGLMHPAKEVGGDFYDCFRLQNGQTCVLIADVSGKSVAGALFMALTKNLVRDRIMQYGDPAEALNSVNDELCTQNPEGMFVTVFAMLTDPATGTVRYANAGHNPPVLMKNGTAEYLNPDPGIALGLFEDAGILTGTMTLARGDGILLYTDGVTEAVDANHAFYGKDRLLDLTRECGKSGGVVDAVNESVAAFASGCEQFDDITAVAVFYHGMPDRMTLRVSLDGFAPVKREILTQCGGSANARKTVLACEEAFVNIVRYSNATEADALVKREDGTLTVEFRDNGIRFDPFSEPLKQDDDFLTMDEGGLGIRFIRTIASDAKWAYRDGRNLLTLQFPI